MSFSLQSHYLLCQKESSAGSLLSWVFYYNSSSGGFVELELSEFRDGTKDLTNPDTYTHKLTDENNTEYVFVDAEVKNAYTFNKITGELDRHIKNKKNEWKYNFYFGYCNFVSTLKLPADANQ